MESQANSKNVIINYGLILAGVSILISITQYAMGMHLEQNWISGLIGFVVLVAIIVLAIKKFKSINGGYLSWGQAVKIGVGVAIISGLIAAIYQYIFITFIEPDFMNQAMELQAQKLLDQGYTDEQIEAAQAMGKKFQSPAIMAAMSIVGSAILGFVVSAIAGAIMQKRQEDNY